MIIKVLQDKILLSTKKDTLKVHLYFKLIQYGIRPLQNDMEVMLELYLFGGYSTAEDQYRFIDICMDKKLKKSKQSVRNTLSKYVNAGVFSKPKNSSLYVNEKFIPVLETDKLVLQHLISHAE